MKVKIKTRKGWFEAEASTILVNNILIEEAECEPVITKINLGNENPVKDKPKYKKGKWYINREKTSLFLFNGKYNTLGNPTGYGFSIVDNLFYPLDEFGWFSDGIKATKEQVIDVFRNYFKKLGFERGVWFRSLLNGKLYRFIGKFDFDALLRHEEIYREYHGMMFKEGKFATPIKE